jgi:hypothetical protein
MNRRLCHTTVISGVRVSDKNACSSALIRIRKVASHTRVTQYNGSIAK